MLSESLLQNLTDNQRAAVLHREGPLLVVAGPGSGKTRVVTHRVAQLLTENVAPHEILVLTFTNKAAGEMKERVVHLTGTSDVWIGTFHRFCARLLRQYADRLGLDSSYTIYSSNDSIASVRDAMARLKEMDAGKDGRFAEIKYSAESIAHALSALKSRYVDPEHDFIPTQGDVRETFLHELIPVHAHQMRLANAVDFDDLLLLTVQLFRNAPDLRHRLAQQFRYVMIDEYQDTNLAQYAISRALTLESHNLMAAGDPDQSIYGWRGANISNILEFERDFPSAKVIRLEENFRSTQLILNAAERLIEHNTQRRPKALFSNLGDGLPVRFQIDADETAEADRIATEIEDAIRSGVRSPSEFAVFYRMNALSLHFERAFRLHGIPFRIMHGTEFFERTEIRDLLAYFRLLANPHDQEAFLRIINVPARGIGKTTLEHLTRYAWENGFSLWEVAVRAENCPGLKSRAVASIQAFTTMIQSLYEFYRTQQNLFIARQNQENAGMEEMSKISDASEPQGVLTALAKEMLNKTGYLDQFEATDELDAQRLRNVQEFLSLASQFDRAQSAMGLPTLETFLEQNALTSDTDSPQEDVWAEDTRPSTPTLPQEKVSLMTLHAAKGLEFPCVYLTACEHGILPHERSQQDETQLEEERRLMFVGMTRAQEELHLSMAQNREFAGKRRVNAPSTFLMELPRDEMRMENFQPTLTFGDDFSSSMQRDGDERLDESFGDAPEECATFIMDESEAYVTDVADGVCEPTDFNPSDFSLLRQGKKRTSQNKKEVRQFPTQQKSSPSESPILKKLPAIPGLMTGADLLRQRLKSDEEDDF